MSELIHEHSARVIGRAGTPYEGRRYRAEVRASRLDGHWSAFIVFRPEDGGRPLHTGRETSQPDRGAVEYWASGLEPIYLDGAFARAAGIAP